MIWAVFKPDVVHPDSTLPVHSVAFRAQLGQNFNHGPFKGLTSFSVAKLQREGERRHVLCVRDGWDRIQELEGIKHSVCQLH